MALDLLHVQSPRRVPVQNPTDEIYDLRAQVDGEFYLHLEDLVISLILVGLRLKGGFASAELIT